MSKSDGPLSGLAGLGRIPGSGGGRRARHRRRGRHSAESGNGISWSALGLAVPVVALVLVLAVVYVLVQFLRGAPSATVDDVHSTFRVPGTLAPLPWPGQGSAALAVDGDGLVGRSGTSAALPIASITKVMTALVVLHDHPLATGQSGPVITITAADVAQYQDDVASQQSVVAVAAGEQITELQALQALLVPSGNNMADVLADWAAGSVPAFVTEMNAEATALGLHDTHFVSPTGLETGSVSTPTDLVRLGEVAMEDPVLAAVVAMPSATLPVAGTVYNYDYDVGHSGFVGIKTGSDTAAGGCFLFDAAVTVGRSTVPVIGAVLDQQATPIIQSALNAATALVQAITPDLASRRLVAAGQQVARITTPWGATAPVVATRAVRSIGWPGLAVHGTVTLRHLGSSVARGERVGTLRMTIGGAVVSQPLTAGAAVGGPGLGWKLTDL